MPANNKMFHTGLYFEARTQSFDANTAPFCLGVQVNKKYNTKDPSHTNNVSSVVI